MRIKALSTTSITRSDHASYYKTMPPIAEHASYYKTMPPITRPCLLLQSMPPMRRSCLLLQIMPPITRACLVFLGMPPIIHKCHSLLWRASLLLQTPCRLSQNMHRFAPPFIMTLITPHNAHPPQKWEPTDNTADTPGTHDP